MIVMTSTESVGRENTATLGMVRGKTVRARHIGKDVLALMRNIVGGEVIEYTKILAEAREQALDRMVEEARQLDANAVLAIRFGTAYVMANVAEILVYGTAVTIEPE